MQKRLHEEVGRRSKYSKIEKRKGPKAEKDTVHVRGRASKR